MRSRGPLAQSSAVCRSGRSLAALVAADVESVRCSANELTVQKWFLASIIRDTSVIDDNSELSEPFTPAVTDRKMIF